MAEHDRRPLAGLDEEAALRTLLEGTAAETGTRFFSALVENLAKALSTHGAWVTEYFPQSRRLRALAFWMDGEWIQNYEIDITGTPCETVVESASLVHIADNLVSLYPDDPEIPEAGAVSYLGMPLIDLDGRVLGHLAVVDRSPMPEEPRVHAIFRIFGARATAELQRLRAESEVREREEKLGRLVDSAMDAIIELDQHLRVTRANPAAEKVFQCKDSEMVRRDFSRFLSSEDCDKLRGLIDQIDARPEGQRYHWIPGGLSALRANGDAFPAEATLSRYEIQRETFHTLILRNVNERLEAEQKIHSLTAEAEYLKGEIRALQHFDEIIGQSDSLLLVLHDVKEVADTDATVLILGETGTGKEVIARAVHASSRRRNKPFITVNCAAIPSTLIESEFFGHERGAFTGARASGTGISPWQMGEPFSSMRSESFPWTCRASCCACCRRGNSSRSAAHGPRRSTFVSSRPRTAISHRHARTGNSGRTCTIGSTSFRSTFRLFATVETTSSCWHRPLLSTSGNVSDGRSSLCHQTPSVASGPTTGPATYGSCRT